MAVALIICGTPPFDQLKGKDNSRIGGHFQYSTRKIFIQCVVTNALFIWVRHLLKHQQASFTDLLREYIYTRKMASVLCEMDIKTNV